MSRENQLCQRNRKYFSRRRSRVRSFNCSLSDSFLFLGIFVFNCLISATKAKQSEAKQYLGAINKGQQTYFIENGNFDDNIPSLGVGIRREETPSYSYKIKVINDRFVVSKASAKDERLKSYSSTLSVYKIDDKWQSLSILCETDQPSLIAPDDFQSVEQCPSGSSKIK